MSADPSPRLSDRRGLRLAVVVVNFRTPDLTIQCLRSVAPEIPALVSCRVMVVDNDSGDDSVARLRAAIDSEGWGTWARVVESDRNRGFAGGNNLGIREAESADFVLLLNSDTIVRPGCLVASVEAMEADPSIGAFSANVLNEDGTIQNVARRFPTPLRLIATTLGLPWRLPGLFRWADMEDPGWDRFAEARDVDWLGGAYLMLRGDVLDRIGGLDESFFFYGEDTALCHSVKRAGYRRRYDPCGEVVHLGGASPDPSADQGQRKNAQAWRSRYLVQRRCYGRLAESAVFACDVAILSVRLVWERLRGGRRSERYSDDLAALKTVTARLACWRK
ncbi:MAG: glycosyltransferase family 2 protein [Planctomycetota bacterium]|jgi:GT2 family glycosyltransferase